jgi:hypothetical protein
VIKGLFTCVQCGAPIKIKLFLDRQVLPYKQVGVCEVVACPNYGILQTGIEQMPGGQDDDRPSRAVN